jgi:hemoglobin
MSEPTLYDRLGGAYPISAVVDYFSDQLVERETIKSENPQIEEWNDEQAAARLPGLKFLRTLWVCAIAGGPFEYTGLPLSEAHYELRITADEFDDVAAVLSDALDHFGVPEREKEEVLGAFAAHKSEVTAGAVAEGSAV